MPLSPPAEQLRLAVLEHLRTTGTLPLGPDLAAELGLTVDAYRAALTELAETRHVALRDGEIEMAHPFATRSFRFSVMGPDTLWWGGCAWDSFAIPNLLPEVHEVLVATTCPACDTPHAWVVDDRHPPAGDQVAHFLVPLERMWPDVTHSCGNQMIYCSTDCVDAWLEATGNPRGYVLTLDTLWHLAAHWYDGRLDTPYERRTPAEATAHFERVGLSGPFWGLPDPA